MNFWEIQTERFLSQLEVTEINYIIKMRAFKYVAAIKEEWLYPERDLSKQVWHNLGGGDLLMPDPRAVDFTVETIYGSSSGRGMGGLDPYGRSASDPNYANADQSKREYREFQRAKAAFAQRHGPKRRGRAFRIGKLDVEEDSPEMHAHHLSYL